MSYLVFCVFDLKNGNREDYLYAYMDLEELGLRKVLKSENGPSFSLPASAVMGTFDGRSVHEVRSRLAASVQSAFEARSLRADFFVVASTDWACAGESM